jgi:hypothetical protein
MAEEGSMADNVAKGRGIVDKSPFKTIGINKQDLETGGHEEATRSRGRPPQDKNWREVGRSADQESRPRG